MARRPSFPRICIALGFDDTEHLVSHAREEAEQGGSFLEFRLDYLHRPEEGLEAIRRFSHDFPECLVLATCRRHQNKGRFDGSIEGQIRLLEGANEAGATAVDVEIESAEAAGDGLEKLRTNSDLIISYHNFAGTAGVDGVMRRMIKIPAAAYKVVTTARKPSDIHRVLSLTKLQGRVPLIVLAMGEIGFPSRVLSPVYGGLYTYAAPATAAGTAAGQVSVKQLRHLYRVEKLTRSSAIYGVIADPVGHSISPAVHNRAFQARRIDAVYVPFRVPVTQLKDFFSLAEKLPLAGFSVTIPHKQKIMRYLDVVEPLARRIGAVNTVWRKAGKWRGTNTDVEGVVQPLGKHIRFAKSSVLVAGNGGAARAAAFALKEQGAKVAIVARNLERARALARACGGEALARVDLRSRRFDALVHATPVGMHPRVNECFFDHDIPADVVLDMVYNPTETMLVRRAQKESKTVIPGKRMFLEQAARQFETWTGSSAPRAAMERAIEEALTPHPEPIM
jgi:3-dehydroquinate dehydratase/shikimate dehydrogenase